MAIKLNGSTSGSVALDAPADTSPSGTDVTLTLPTSAGSSGQYLQTNGSGGLSWQTVSDTTGNDYNFASGSLSGSSILITGIPANAMQIVVNFDGAGWTTSGYNPIVRLGNSGGISGNGNYLWTSGFTGAGSAATWYADGFLLNYGFQSNDDRIHGSLYLSKFSGNTWKATWQAISSKYSGATQYILFGAGSGDAGGTLDRLEILISTATFNTGSYNINVFTE